VNGAIGQGIERYLYRNLDKGIHEVLLSVSLPLRGGHGMCKRRGNKEWWPRALQDTEQKEPPCNGIDLRRAIAGELLTAWSINLSRAIAGS